MTSLSEERPVVKFCFLLDKNATETVVILNTPYKDDAMGKTQVYEWFSRFKNGDTLIEDKPRFGRPSTSRTDENVVKVKEIVLADRRQTIDQISEISGLYWSSVQRILTEDLTTKIIAAKFVLRVLTDTQ